MSTEAGELHAVASLALTAGVARAVFPTNGVASYAGCLNTNASPGGTFVNVAVGDAPARACGSGQLPVHLSGGDLTKVVAGTGLKGGGDNGEVTLSIDPKYALPQSCATGGQILKWNGTGWLCGTDNDTTYNNGAGIDLTGTTFSVSASYRLPQSCANGQVAKADGNGGWVCSSDENSGGTITGVAAGTGLTGGGSSGTVGIGLAGGYQLPQNCSSGQVAKSDGSNGWTCAGNSNSLPTGYSSYGGTIEIHRGFTTTVNTLNIDNAPGSYVISAVETIGAGSVSGGGNAECDLVINGNVDYSSGADANLDYALGSATEMTATDLGPSAKIEVECYKDPETGAFLNVVESRIIAIRMGSLTIENGGP